MANMDTEPDLSLEQEHNSFMNDVTFDKFQSEEEDVVD